MNMEQIAARYDSRVGYRLVAYGPVGLPVYRLTTISLCLAKKELDPIEEFVLRGVYAGIGSVGQLSGLLGLETVVIESCLSELIRTECVRVHPAATDSERVVSLTPKGKDTALQQETIVPIEQSVVFWFDGLTRKPRFYLSESLMKPRDLKEAGIPEIRAFPARPPDLGEIDINDVIEVVRIDRGRTESPLQLLQISSIERRERVFLDALALAYKADSGGEIQVDFAIDGRLSREHGQAFARANGVEKTKLFRGLLERPARPLISDLVGEGLSRRIEEVARSQNDSKSLQQKARAVRARISKARIDTAEASTPEVAEDAQQEEKESQEELLNLKGELDSLQVRPVAVYEHAALLRDAIENAKERIIIVSPWIRRAVVNMDFIKLLGKALKRGVTIYIGYGLGGDEGDKQSDLEARQELEKLANSSERFILKRTGYSHAKVLIKDCEYFVITSFNWLSFRGDLQRTFREEWGTLVCIPSMVEDYFRQMVERFG
jgi:hypothetical protein